jgi:hypothetical protein
MTKRVLMRLDKFLAEILASIDPPSRPLMKPDGTFCGGAEQQGLVRIIESALLWYKVLRGCSRAIGFTNPYDPCVFIRVGKAAPSLSGATSTSHAHRALRCRRWRRGQAPHHLPGLAVHRGAPSTT